MKKLYLAQRPAPGSLRGMFVWFAVVAIIEIVIGASIPSGVDVILCGILGSAAALPATFLPFLIRSEARWKRDLPEKIEEFLNQELSEQDYAALYRIARKSPAVRSMVAAALKDGKLFYREAEPLAGQINRYLVQNSRERPGCPRQKLGKLVSQSSSEGALSRKDSPPPAA